MRHFPSDLSLELFVIRCVTRPIASAWTLFCQPIYVELCDDDEFIVLACDGIWDCMSSQQLVDFLREQLNTESKLSVVCERVIDRCLAPATAGGEGCDNMTTILVQFKKPHESAAAAEKSSTSDHGNQSATAAADEKSSTSNQADTELKPVETESSPRQVHQCVVRLRWCEL
ncbi:putative protein phosphatase 2C 60 [Camellia lanceoleosa]|uniref:Uncharacterized protein n=1 Tax=Camellia lanceoleosa TaxID=1840588 RepID=A0ACC0FGA6_9ERIC|nr:putative protein phosphatase 2C 60 [Camellia lanceoleosa]